MDTVDPCSEQVLRGVRPAGLELAGTIAKAGLAGQAETVSNPEPAGRYPMPYRSEDFTSGQYYHLYNRGASRGRIFFTDGNYQYLTGLMRRLHSEYGVVIIAYCLMPNHYHLLIRQETEQPLSKFVNVLFNRYVQAVNMQQGRSGTLFEGRFRHKRVERWEYLIHLCRYIHRNPVKGRLVPRPEDWPFSNFMEWIGLRDNGLKDEAFIREHFSRAQDYIEFVSDQDGERLSSGRIRGYMLD
jgi:REP-associated tyrosine transposase